MSSKAQNLLDFYKQLLPAFSMEVDDDNLISFRHVDGDVQPSTIEGRRLVLPTAERLREGMGEEFMAFHPLCESISRRGVSPVMEQLRVTARALIALYVSHIADRLLRVAADPELQRDLPASIGDYLKKIPDADKKSVQVLESVLKAAAKQKNGIVTVYLKNGGTYKGTKVNRLCTIRFPLLEAIDGADDGEVYGVKLSRKVKDKRILSELFHHIVPLGDDAEEYSAGSNINTTPYFDAFMQAYTKIAKQLNKLIKRYGKQLDIQLEEIPLDFTKQLEDLGKFRNAIAPQRGNEGGVSEVEASQEKAAAEVAKAQPKATPSNPQTPQRATPSQAPSQPAESEMDRIRRALGGGNQPQPYPTQQPQYGYPQTHQPMPGYGYPPQPQQAPGPFDHLNRRGGGGGSRLL